MDVTISIPDEVAPRLRSRAAETGQTVSEYAARLVAESIGKPSIDELLAPVRADFAKTGMTEAELMDFGRDIVKKVRDEKKAKAV